ncbi:extracellular solute-binding protein family 1 [Xylanimonas cellulosilytica DSM 15894]|uniref:Extracellular solute-binding protein family 1 n=1 Tax=Xylanimonas cellulosilytica (strain DSM 15894 / JCM 12276 / CECT 5975 / KCTC 9989 / LMG 20990 / NBRC 107835 / XIL07) TaxID=446471 RepID=D1C030_XYLCX|nr:ABC transporter substrate-binding protein [Xylanimonas cellulosilytica]ACZ30219.1 extracellular solute-binding protein family 1 [Xylanimonas cellulosilytica DSM 15894]
MRSKKAIALLMAPVLGALTLTACSSGANAEDDTSAEPVALDQDWSTSDPITIDVFDGLANYQGIQSGWFGKLVKDKFNMELNIIAPNVAGGGDTLYNTRVAGGDLGDLIITDKGEKMDELIAGGLLLDVSKYYGSMESVSQYDAAVQRLNDGKDGIYGLPTQVSTLPPTAPSEGIDPTFGAYLRWDYYADAGYPEIGTLEDLLPILKEMQDAHPTADNGGPTYGLSLFKDWDGNMMVMGKQPACLYGFDEMGFVLAKADGSEYQSIIDSDSAYVRSLQLYFDANQLGILDPESTTQNYDTMFAKYQNGQVLLSWWPWLGQSAYNTTANLEAGKGFEMVPLADQEIFSYGAEVYGGKQVLAIGSHAEDPDRIAAFVDWLYSREGVLASGNQTMGAAGPEGLTWELVGDQPELTDFGKAAILGGDGDVPAEWGGGKYADGVSALNVTTVLPIDTDPKTGYEYNYKYWPSVQEITGTALTDDWSAHMDDATSTMDYLVKNDQVLVAPGSGFTTPADSSEIETIRNQVKASVVEYSWKMVYAKDQAEFDSLLAQLQSTAEGLGYAKVLEVDMANAEAQNEAREAVVDAFAQ